ncbi:hypothetical protein EOA27_12595 [Mesorhizobium sp. M2A.F.Ca.ET.037.01.1.1]|uniref:hypothetical protein n=1 Tax=unclassified Mesorhizobium TaxID=325217 RepID=UPI000F74F88F|nr:MULTISPECIES: hypothetical protein [unclassified Mesorhizobium]RUY02650.1 hypothetical protein EOA25_21120 [Mesorhizobium sp. M2A.F.Ca.ET.040.01.1.1]RVC66857.1 hypothetical protein EN759_17375 [Mesorhizobium sp. M00.F.Ca.ET.038.03.1.1]RVC71050.1 hypothetical protein EN766_27395 [Mesorhizobium sp. M2A.F.Ca.ET.046.02.1.1]AZO39149.1 hypothetical protein EJ072_35345 [Mesorhizobium sp. M2A.F.Ca.ET.046.03.2.1]RUX19026.1 hypothetical protein EOA27_12595 [Mesorhizobium sp. M2A.F.Ca.ET.037.01.1.1]
MAEFRAFPMSSIPRRTYMRIRLNKLIFRQTDCPFDPDFFWVHFAARHRATGSGRFSLEAASEAL